MRGPISRLGRFCLPNTECKIVDYNNGAELGANEEGENWVRGPQVMKVTSQSDRYG